MEGEKKKPTFLEKLVPRKFYLANNTLKRAEGANHKMPDFYGHLKLENGHVITLQAWKRTAQVNGYKTHTIFGYYKHPDDKDSVFDGSAEKFIDEDGNEQQTFIKERRFVMMQNKNRFSHFAPHVLGKMVMEGGSELRLYAYERKFGYSGSWEHMEEYIANRDAARAKKKNTVTDLDKALKEAEKKHKEGLKAPKKSKRTVPLVMTKKAIRKRKYQNERSHRLKEEKKVSD